MHQVLVYADSLSWGIIPGTRRRFPYDQRWPGIMELRLVEVGKPVRVVEDCLNGRRTVWDDPFLPGRNGLRGIEQRIEANSPLPLIVLFLGTNDFQSMYDHGAWHSAQGINALIVAIRRAPIEPGMPEPEILVVAPPPIQEARGPIAPKFAGAESKAIGLASAIEGVATENRCPFFDAGTVTETSKVDGEYLDADQHLVLGKALAAKVAELL